MSQKRIDKKLKIAGGVAAAGILAAQFAGAGYLFRRTVTRKGADVGRTMDMAGTDWEQYMPFIKSCHQWQDEQYREDVWITTRDGLRLHGTYFPGKEGREGTPKRLVIAFHGYSSEGMKDYTALSRFYIRDLGCAMLMVDQRSHGQSQGEYIGFGVLDRYDALSWIEYVNGRLGTDVEIYLHGTSMGGATVVMTSGQKLPDNVKGIISDCAFTSAFDVFSHVLKSWYHLPPFPMMQIAGLLSRKKAGYGLKECDGAKEVEKAQVPILFIHGDKDNFVPVEMCEKLYQNCRSPKQKLIVAGASHAESYYKDTQSYQEAIREFFHL